mgnify:CR=1 FL=1
MAISKRAMDLTDGIYVSYGSGSGYLFGIEPDRKEAVKAIVQAVLDRMGGSCPFCGETGFDKYGLKSHLEHGDCAEYNDIATIKREF